MTNTRTSLGHQPSTLSYQHSLSYTRGKDLSGALEEAGGIGGLLARSDGYSAGNWTNHNYYFADGNGNITYVINSSQAMVASYRHDPFGNTVSKSGKLADANVYRFSSKEIHVNSGMYYYLYRFYDPNLQRWINRDPVGEPGFLLLVRLANALAKHVQTPTDDLIGEGDGDANLFAFVLNRPVLMLDIFGLKSKWWPPWNWPFWPKPKRDDPDSWPIPYDKPWPSSYNFNDKWSVHWWSNPFPDRDTRDTRDPKYWCWFQYKF